MRPPHSLALSVALALVVVLALGAAPAGAARWPSPPSPGSAGLGDRLFPELGNGGYDVLHYHLDLHYATSAPNQSLDGTVKIVARATQSLSRFNLDFGGQSVGAVSVNRRAADWTREGEELVITPKRALRKHRIFVVRIANFTAAPTEPDPEDFSTTAFFITPDGSATAAQPNFAHRIFPSNDHPRDKASFTFRFDVPTGTVAVANGVLTGHHTGGERDTWSYLQRQPMATELIQLAVGNYDITWRGRHRGVLVRDVTAPSLTEFLDPKLALELNHLDWMEDEVGRYPFDIYGSLVVDAEIGFALETQTLSIYDRTWFTDSTQGVWEPTMLHELAHMWFGDSVAPWEWSDLWLNEGHASWYEFLYAEEKGFLEEDTTNWPNETGYADFDDLMRAVYALGDQWRADFGPVAEPVSPDALFSFQSYHGGALVLYALRQEIGERAFGRLQRAWVHRYRDESASTADFIALASRVAHRDLSAFLRAWLYDLETPPMPGHPDWTLLPVEEPVPTVQSLRSAEGAGTGRRR
ncbi:MAG: M1 family metallopeptidase [Actinomycetota bacterium]|nr:M1 family metallopeptidase [Actinomycetota bacterium]